MYIEHTLDVQEMYNRCTFKIHKMYRGCMSVRKPLEKQKLEIIDVDALIEKGAKVKEDIASDEKKWNYINIRISTEMLKHVDEAVNSRVGITRTGWILESIYEKLTRL